MASTDTSGTLPGMDQYRQEVVSAADQQLAGAADIRAQADKTGQQEIDLAEKYADSQVPFTEQPPKDQINQVMKGAPWLFALAALGGAASKVNGLAMIEGLNGVSGGILSGNQEALDQSWKKYQAGYEKWKARSDQQFRIYQVLSEAYGSAGDAKLRALTAAQQMTNDATQMKLNVDDPRTIMKIKAEVETAHAHLMEAQAKMKEAGAFGDARVQGVLGALAEKGIALPTGLRAKQQMQATIKGLIDRNPEKSDAEIAELVGKGQIEFGAEKKETQTAAAVAGRVSVAAKEIQKFAPIVLQSSLKVPRGSFMPITQLLQSADTKLSDPALKRLKISINSMLNAYDLLAARGGTDKHKREEAHALITAADSPEALAAGVEMFQIEAKAAEEAAAEAEQPSKKGPKTVSFNDLP